MAVTKRGCQTSGLGTGWLKPCQTAVVYLARIFPSDDCFRIPGSLFHTEAFNVARVVMSEKTPRPKANIQGALVEHHIEEFRPYTYIGVRKSERAGAYTEPADDEIYTVPRLGNLVLQRQLRI